MHLLLYILSCFCPKRGVESRSILDLIFNLYFAVCTSLRTLNTVAIMADRGGFAGGVGAAGGDRGGRGGAGGDRGEFCIKHIFGHFDDIFAI